ncbi:MAG: IS1634 family transposase [Desulfobulbus sp.]|nr:IS1634 family transposase [Desulfobulbus sp.]
MYIRQTKTSSATSGEAYFTFRLVASKRVDGKVRQQTLLNLGRTFSVPREQWPVLCSRIEQIISGQMSLTPISKAIEGLAQRYAARLVSDTRVVTPAKDTATPVYHEVDVDSLELVRPRSIGVEHAGLAALGWLELPRILEHVGLGVKQQAAIIGNVIGRMAAPASELATWGWLQERSGLGELLDVDYEAMPLMSLYRASDLLVRHRQPIEAALFSRINDLFSLPTTVTLFDLTNTYFEGEMAGNGKAKRGHSKEKRSDCPLVTLGLVLDGSGFVRRSRMFEGNVAEASTLEEMLQGLDAPTGALVIMDRGIATAANISWLIEHHYRYLVVSRERTRQFDLAQSEDVATASDQTVHLQRVVSDDGLEVRLYCHSEARQEKEKAMTDRFIEKFETGLAKLAAGLLKPRGEKNRDKLMQRIGRLQQQSHGIGQHYRIELTPAEGALVTGITWTKEPIDGTQLTHPGVYCLRTNEVSWDAATLWRTYTQLTDLEAVFRSLKSELGLRPVYHHKEDRAEGHLFITVLAYQAVQVLRRKLNLKGINDSWLSLREIFSGQQRVTATFTQKDGRTLHVRKTTVAEQKLQGLYNALGLSASPVGTKKLVH